MSPADFRMEVQAHNDRERREWERTAWMVAYIINPHLKKPVTPAQLLGMARRSSHTDDPWEKLSGANS